MLAAFLSIEGFSQEAWNGLNFKAKPLRRVALRTELQHRALIKDLKTDNLFIENEASFLLFPSVELSGLYRHRFLPEDAKSKNRLAASLSWKPVLKDSKAEFSLRGMAQRDMREKYNYRDLLRIRGEAGYDMGNGVPYISFEVFHKMNEGKRLQRVRSTVGVTGDLTDWFEINVFYRRDDYFDLEDERRDPRYIFGLTGTIKLYRIH